MKLFPLILLLTLTGCGSLHKVPDEVSDLEVKLYKAGMDKGCRDAGRAKGDSQSKIDGFCGCMMEKLNQSLSYAEWQKATFFAQKKLDAEELQSVAPQKRGIDACRERS